MPSFNVHRSAQPVPEGELARILADPGFGRFFSDHMATAEWTPEAGWRDFQVTGLQPFSLHPGTAALHYAQEIFEGLKAFRHADGSIWLFRPDLNARRFRASARRLMLPELDEGLFVESIEALVRADQRWVPDGDKRSLYIRPFMFGAEAFLGVRPAVKVTYCVIASPAAGYFAAGSDGVTLWVSETYARAGKGGTGAAKCGGNYASSLAAQAEAQRNGCAQVLYVSMDDQQYLEESGTMNLFLVTADHQLVTPTLGTILDGVTRSSVIELAVEHNLKPVERQFTLDQLRAGCADGSIIEAFAAGTAAVITPILGFKGNGFENTVGDGQPGSATLDIRSHILDIQYGRIADDRNWLHRVDQS